MTERYKPLETALVITAALLLFYHQTHHIWLLRLAIVVSAGSVLWPAAARGLHAGWMYLALALGWINSRILLSVVFFLLLTPLAWLARQFGSNPLQLTRKKAEDGTYYVVREQEYEKKDLEEMW